MAAKANDRATAGPAWTPAALPVSTKMPVPMMTPTPNTVRSSALSCLRSWWVGSSVSRIDCSIVLVRHRFIRDSFTERSEARSHPVEPASPKTPPSFTAAQPLSMDSGCDVCRSPYRDRGWRDQIAAASLDRYRGHPTAERTRLPETIRVLDAFQVVRLAPILAQRIRPQFDHRYS